MRWLIVAALAVLSMVEATLATPVVDYFDYGSTQGTLKSFGSTGGGWAGGWSGGSEYYLPTMNLRSEESRVGKEFRSRLSRKQ